MKQEEYRGPEKAGGDRWLVTFNDLMTLVLTFFVLLLAFSAMKPDYLVQATNSFRNTLGGGVTAGGGVMRVFQPFVQPLQDPDIEMEKSKRALGKDRETLARIKAKLMSDRGVVTGAVVPGSITALRLALPTETLFDPQSHELSARGREIVTLVSAALKGEAVFVHVAIDDASSFVSGALLSAATESTVRTASLARYLSSLGDVDAARITAGPARKGADGNYGGEEMTAAARPVNIYISTRAI